MSKLSIEQNDTNGQPTELIPVYKSNEEKTGNDISLRAPQSVINRMWFFAEKYAMSNLYKTNGFKNVADYFIAFIKGYELGIPLSSTFDFFYQVNSKICTDGKGMLALLYNRPEVADVIIEEGETKATVTIKLRNGKTGSASFSMDDARKANLLEKMGWKNYPSSMLVWRALSKCVRFTAPHIVGGLTYTKEELESAVETITDPQSRDILDFNLYIAEVAPDYPDTHWFMVNPRSTVGFIRGLKPEWEKIPPLEVVKQALKTLNANSFLAYETGKEAIDALRVALGLPIPPPQPATNITPMPTDKPADTPSPDTSFSIGEDPLSIQPNSTPPTASALSGEPDPNDPEDIRHSIPIYGEGHWYVTNYKNFVKILRKFVDGEDSMLDHEVSTAGLRMLGIQTWKDFALGRDALDAIKAKVNALKNPQATPKPAPQPPSKPQTAPVPQPALKPVPTTTRKPASQLVTPPDWYDEFESFIWTHFDIDKISEWESKAGKNLFDYTSLDEAKRDATRIALEDCWDLTVDKATYFSPGERGQTYIIFKSLVGDIRMYGRSSGFKKAVGDNYYTHYGVEKWEHGEMYSIGLLKVSWKRNEQGTAIAEKVEVLEEEDAGITPEELDALATVEM